MVRGPVPAIVLLSKTRKFTPYCLSPPRCMMGTNDILLGATMRWTRIPSKKSSTFSCFMLQKPGKALAVWASLALVRLNLYPFHHCSQSFERGRKMHRQRKTFLTKNALGHVDCNIILHYRDTNLILSDSWMSFAQTPIVT